MTDKHRPRLHFTPKTGWMNDPNGLIEVDGAYHMFFQHDPDSINHGPMHWGHAVSTDLCHWTERPVALYPDEHGTCFSGSAIRTPEGEVKLLHTAHRKAAGGRDFQTQCLVHVSGDMSQFTGDPANPVLDNPGLEAFRDPKVIWHEGTGRWIMAVTLGHLIGFYSSANLLDWRHESSFGEDEARAGEGVWECPDLLPMSAPDGSTAWVLIVSLASGAYGAGSGTRYYVGKFDGHRFTSANPPHTDLWLDYGRDCYAPQTFFHDDLSAPIAIAWASNWTYARSTPTTGFRGAMTLPRTLALVDTAAGLRLSQSVPDAVRQAFAEGQGGTFHRVVNLPATTGSTCEIALFGDAVPQLTIVRTGPTAATVRTRRDDHPAMRTFGHDYGIDVDCEPGVALDIELYVDHGLVEFIVNRGKVFVTNLHFPDDVATAPVIRVEAPRG